MYLKTHSSAWLKALMCVAFALALVFSPHSATHAASGIHDGHQAKSVGILGAAAAHDTRSEAHDSHTELKVVSDIGIAVSDKDDNKQQSDECCNGICISDLLSEESRFRSESVGSKEYVIPEGQTHSVETTGFLRPPRFLI